MKYTNTLKWIREASFSGVCEGVGEKRLHEGE